MRSLRQQVKRMKKLLVRHLSPSDYRRAVQIWKENGTMPSDPRIRELVENLQALEQEFDEIHVLAEDASSSSPESSGDHDAEFGGLPSSPQLFPEVYFEG